MTPDFTPVKILVSYKGSKIPTFLSEKRGLLCIHRDVDQGTNYSLTHIPTGYTLLNRQPRWIAQRMLQTCADWSEWLETNEEAQLRHALLNTLHPLAVRLARARREYELLQKAEEELRQCQG